VLGRGTEGWVRLMAPSVWGSALVLWTQVDSRGGRVWLGQVK
jgi:hypothetical protein